MKHSSHRSHFQTKQLSVNQRSEPAWPTWTYLHGDQVEFPIKWIPNKITGFHPWNIAWTVVNVIIYLYASYNVYHKHTLSPAGPLFPCSPYERKSWSVELKMEHFQFYMTLSEFFHQDWIIFIPLLLSDPVVHLIPSGQAYPLMVKQIKTPPLWHDLTSTKHCKSQHLHQGRLILLLVGHCLAKFSSNPN